MLCFEVSVNGKLLCRAGVGDAGVLTAMLTWAQISPEFRKAQGVEWEPSEPFLRVGGLSDNHHIDWLNDRFVIQVGDEITVKVVEADTVDLPVKHRDTKDPAIARARRYKLYTMYKREFEADGVLLPKDELDSTEARLIRRELYEELKREFEDS